MFYKLLAESYLASAGVPFSIVKPPLWRHDVDRSSPRCLSKSRGLGETLNSKGMPCVMACLFFFPLFLSLSLSFIYIDMIWYDIWYMIYDIWHMIYDVWYLIYDIWYMMYDIWYMIYDAWYLIYDVWCMIYDMIWFVCYIIYICTYTVYILYIIMYSNQDQIHPKWQTICSLGNSLHLEIWCVTWWLTGIVSGLVHPS